MSFHWKPTNVPVPSPLQSEDLRQQLQASEKALNSLKDSHQELLSRIDHLQAERDKITHESDQLAQQAALWETQKLDYQEAIKNSTFQIRTLEEKLKFLNEKLLATESQLTSQQNSSLSLQTTLSELERSYHTSQTLLSHKELEFRDFKATHSDIHQRVIEQNETLNATIAKLQKKIESANLGLKNSEESHETKVQNLKDQIKELTFLLSVEQQNRARIEHSFDQFQIEHKTICATLKQSLQLAEETYSNKLNRKNQKLESLRQTFQTQSSDFSTLEATLNEQIIQAKMKIQELVSLLAQEQEKSLLFSMRQRVVIDLDVIRIRSDPIGTGGEGAIYRGSWCGSPVAIKELRNCRSILESNDFHAELDIPTSIQHPHIIQVFGCGLRSCDNNLYIVMALKDFSLEKVIELESISMLFSVRDRLIIALQILSGLWHLHQHGILHGDLKPENILLEESSPGKIKVVLADFGRSKELTLTLRKMTSSQVSTLAYSPPEHFEDSSGLKSDIYSFAIILWELTSKKRAWKGKSLPYITNSVCNQNKRPELDHLLDSPDIASLIECCWLREFTQRPSAEEAYKKLKLIIRGPDLSIDPPPIPVPPPPQPGPSHHAALTQIVSSKPLTELIHLAIAQLKPSSPSKKPDAIASHPLFASLFGTLQKRRTIIMQSDSDDDEFN